MKVRDIMSTNLVTIPSNTSIADAKRIMTAHRIKRLPVVDKDKVVGIVTERGLDQVSPSKATSLSVWELSYLLEKTPVKDIMRKELVTVTPDTDAEEAVGIAQSNKVGALLVLENSHAVGITTTNDFFYRIINPILGINIPGTRIEILGGGEGKKLEDIISTINKNGLNIVTLHIEEVPDKKEKDVCFHIQSNDVSKLLSELQAKGYKANVRKR